MKVIAEHHSGRLHILTVQSLGDIDFHKIEWNITTANGNIRCIAGPTTWMPVYIEANEEVLNKLVDISPFNLYTQHYSLLHCYLTEAKTEIYYFRHIGMP